MCRYFIASRSKKNIGFYKQLREIWNLLEMGIPISWKNEKKSRNLGTISTLRAITTTTTTINKTTRTKKKKKTHPNRNKGETIKKT